MNQLEDFAYQINQLDTADLVAHTQDPTWIEELDDAELILLIHELVSRLPEDTSSGWYIQPEDEEDEHEYE